MYNGVALLVLMEEVAAIGAARVKVSAAAPQHHVQRRVGLNLLLSDKVVHGAR
jgi:hypothetical protein